MIGLWLGSFLIIFVSFLTFLPSFSLALFGDDWLAFWRYLQHLGPQSSGQWNHLTYFLTPYGSQDILMGLLYKVFGFQSSYYQLTSFFLRMIAAFSLYPIVFYLTKSKLATFFAILFFSVTATGLDTTNWVFNMPSYVTIALFNLFLYFFLKSRDSKSVKSFLLSGLLYYLAYIITPIRMHGSLPFIFFVEVFWILQKGNKQTLKRAAIRFAIIYLVFLFIRYSGQSMGPPEEVSQRLSTGVTLDLNMLGQGRFDFLFYPIIMFGSMIIPDISLSKISTRITDPLQALFILLPTFIFFIITAGILINNIKTLSNKFLIKFVLATLIWTFSVMALYIFNPIALVNSVYLILISVGGYTLILAFLLFREYRFSSRVSTGLFMSIAWSYFSFIAAWWFVPNTIYYTAYRYFIVSAVGIAIFLACLISLGKERKNRIIICSWFIMILILQIISTRSYLSEIAGFRSQQISDSIWNSIPYVKSAGKESLVFYFEGDYTNVNSLHDVLTFGFPVHIALLYNLKESDKIPVPMTDWKEVVSAVRDGQSFKAYGYPLSPIPVNNIYAFHLQGKDNLINITDLARQKLVEDGKK